MAGSEGKSSRGESSSDRQTPSRARPSVPPPLRMPRGTLHALHARREDASDFQTEEPPCDVPLTLMRRDVCEDVTREPSTLMVTMERRSRAPTSPPAIPIDANRVPDRVGDWFVEYLLGRGGMGAVYAVSHHEFGKRAALKLCHRTTRTGGLGAKVFLREARIVQLVDHIAMPDVFATGTYRGRPYLVMERLIGATLAELVDDNQLQRARAIEILIDLCDVLDAAHDAGVVHHDLKLDNVFVLEQPNAHGAHVKLLDWGFARLLDEDDPFRGVIAGTLNYVAPEQVLGTEITPACDVYSLGVLTYRLLLGEKPFSGTTHVELVKRHIYDAPPDPTLLWPGMPKDLAALITAMLAKDPTHRPTIAEVRAVLDGMQARVRRRFTRKIETTPSVRPTLKQRMMSAVLPIAAAIAAIVGMATSCT
ncbi:MAG TPA: serine/threonine-protein kinase [Xanthomonadales bacterium]|nr:serine/threonine-protein kinase [Xanthomonadales bacterium]